MRILGLTLISFALAACGDNHEVPADSSPVDSAPDAAPQPSAARGEYLVLHVAACTDCHTPRLANGMLDMTKFLSGVECFVDVNGGGIGNGGCLNSRNLTNDPTGLMNRSDAEIKNMFQNGMRPTGQALVPVMPYWIFHNLTDLDAQSIVLYLRTVPGVAHTVPANDATFFPPPAQPAAPLDLAKVPQPAIMNTATSHGRYLASIACVECHTALTNPNDFRSIDETKILAGNRDFPRDLLGLPPVFPPDIFSANLTPHATGIGSFTGQQISDVLRLGVDKAGGGVCPPMPAGPMAAFGGLTRQDAIDIASYLLSIPAVNNPVTATCTAP